MRPMGLLAICLVLLASSLEAAERAHVYLIVIDGLDARFATRARMPRLFALVERETGRSSFFPAARAVMPARTNSNHASLLTGAYPEAHGITGNAYWSRKTGSPPEKLDSPALLAVETLFTVAETTAPELATLGVFAKPKLARLFGGAPNGQHAPDRLWSGEQARRRDPATGYALGDDALDEALRLIEEIEPDLAVVGLADVDRAAHAHGPESPECERAVATADAAIGRLADRLIALGRWGRSVLVVTADHGFTALTPTPERPEPVISFGREVERAKLGGVLVVADGGVDHVYATDLGAEATEAGGSTSTLTRAAALAREIRGVAEVLARLPVPGVPLLAVSHPGWYLAHPHTGELLLVAAPGYQFVDPFDPVDAGLLGNHGGPQDLTVPLVVTGGVPALAAAPARTPQPTLVDVAPTIATLLGLRAPRRLDGSALPAEQMGRPLAVLMRPETPSRVGN